MIEKETLTVISDEILDKVNGGVVMRSGTGFFAGTYECQCGNKDYKVIEVYDNGTKLLISCKKCGKLNYVDN